MQRDNWKHLAIEVWAFVAAAAIAFVAGLLIGNVSSSPKIETAYVAAPSSEEGAGASEEGAGATEPSNSAEVFTSAGCASCHTLKAAGSTGVTGPNLDKSLAADDTTQGIEVMIIDPNTELVEGYSPNVMPQTYGQTLSKAEIHGLAEFLVASTPAEPTP